MAHPGRDWASVKEAYADRVIAQLAEHAPGVAQAILARHVMSPDDFEGRKCESDRRRLRLRKPPPRPELFRALSWLEQLSHAG